MRKVLDFFNRFGSAIWWGCVLLILLVVYINRAEFKQIVIDQLEWSLEVDAKGDPEAIQSKLLDLLKGEEAEISGTYMDIGGSVQIEIFQDETGLNYILTVLIQTCSMKAGTDFILWTREVWNLWKKVPIRLFPRCRLMNRSLRFLRKTVL